MLVWVLGAALAAGPDPAVQAEVPSQGEDFAAWAARQDPPATHAEVALGYRYAGELWPEVARLVAERPGVVAPESIGRSRDGRHIWAFHVRDPSRPVERRVLVFAGIHALEWISTEVALETLAELAESPAPGVLVTVVPILNPDGRDRVERDLDAGRNAYRRGNQANVDLNRDFAVNRDAVSVWRHVLPGYHATTGTALSQPESRALDALADRERYDRSASLHAFGGFFYYPWAGRFRPPEDAAEFVALGRAMEAAQGNRPYVTRQLGRWLFAFRAHGAEIDHLYGRYGTRAFLVELTRSGVRPFQPRTWKTYFRWYNPEDPDDHVAAGARAMRALVTTRDPS